MKKVKFFCFIIIIVIAISVCGCGAGGYKEDGFLNKPFNTGNEYNEISENPFKLVSEYPDSNFAMNSNTAAYSNIRRYIHEGRQIDKNMVRIEEMVNYFRYDYALPKDDEALAISGAISPCPWNSEAKLLTVGVRAEEIEFKDVNNNIVFLMDISDSMNSPDKMPLMQAAFCMLSENLNENDYVSIVAYAGTDKVVLDGARGYERKKIQNAIEDLKIGGSTAGAQGIKTAYTLAEKHFIDGGNNRIILATDGDFNVGISSQSDLENFIKEKHSTKIGLTVLGFGYGNLKDNKLESLAKYSFEGNYAYVDNILECRKVLVEEIGGTLVTVAQDVKAEVKFNPLKVHSYRLLGYENKLLTLDEWDNPNKKAGDIGSGHCVTAVYEIILKPDEAESTAENFLKISIRYKNPKTNDDCEISAVVNEIANSLSDDIKFISAVVEAALIMRNSEYKGSANMQSVVARLESIKNLSDDPYKKEFLWLIR